MNPKHTNRPLQKVSYKKKIANDYQWVKDNINYWSNISTTRSGFLSFFGPTQSQADSYQDYFDWYNNDISDEKFHHVTNPFNSKRKELQQFPARIKAFNIMWSKITQHLGEYRRRPFVFNVEVNNDDAPTIYQERLKKKIMEQLEMFFNQTLEALENGEEPPEANDGLLEELKDEFASDYTDERALKGHYAVKLILKDVDFHDKRHRLFKDYIIGAQCVSYRNVVRDEIVYARIDPREIKFDDTKEYIEDSDFCVRTYTMSISDVVEEFYDELTDKQIDELEKFMFGNAETIPTLFRNNRKDENQFEVTVEHVTFKSFRKIGILTYEDEFGQEQTVQVDEDYKKIGEEDELEWHWIVEIWEGYRVNNEHYFRMRPIPNQRYELNNKSTAKLPYNGIGTTSLVKIMRSYQVLFIICMYQLEMALASHIGKVILIDKGSIPNSDGWSTEKFMYYAKALKFMVVDKNQIGSSQHFNQYTTMDASQLNEVAQIMQLAEQLDLQMGKLIGITPERMGQGVQKSTMPGTLEQAISQSSVIAEYIYGNFDEFVRRELEALLDLSKSAWKDGKKALLRNDDLRNFILDIEPEVHKASDFGITISNDAGHMDILEKYKRDVIQPLAQNGTDPRILLSVSKADNLLELDKTLSKLEKVNERKMKEQQQMEQEASQQEQQQAAALEEMRQMFELQKIELQGQIDAQLKEMDQLDTDLDRNNNYSDDVKMAVEKYKADVKAAADKYKADKQLEVAKENKNKYD